MGRGEWSKWEVTACNGRSKWVGCRLGKGGRTWDEDAQPVGSRDWSGEAGSGESGKTRRGGGSRERKRGGWGCRLGPGRSGRGSREGQAWVGWSVWDGWGGSGSRYVVAGRGSGSRYGWAGGGKSGVGWQGGGRRGLASRTLGRFGSKVGSRMLMWVEPGWEVGCGAGGAGVGGRRYCVCPERSGTSTAWPPISSWPPPLVATSSMMAGMTVLRNQFLASALCSSRASSPSKP